MSEESVPHAELPDPATVAKVATLLAVAGVPADPDEVIDLARGYPAFVKSIESLYAIPECRYESPALNFTATPVFADWW